MRPPVHSFRTRHTFRELAPQPSAPPLEAADTDPVAKAPQKTTPQRSNVTPRLLTYAEAGAYLARTERAVEMMVHRGKLTTVNDGRTRRIDRLDLDRWIEQNKG